MDMFDRRRFLRSSATAVSASFAVPAILTSTQARAAVGRPLLKPVHEDIVCPWSPAHPRHDHQLIFPLNANRLMLVWCEYYANRPSLLDRKPNSKSGQAADDMPCRIQAMISKNNGRTWLDGFTLQDNLWKQNVKHPNLFRLSASEILFTCVGWDSNAQRNVFMKRSTDNGETWSELEQLSEPGFYCNNADRALTLSDGRLVLPAHGAFSADYIGAAPYQGRKSKLHSFVFFSDDKGQSWRRSNNSMTAKGRGCHEPTIAELKNGRLLCLLRNSNQRIYQSVSEDRGETWSEPEPTLLPSPESPALLKRIPATGDLLLLWNHVASRNNWPRTPLTAAISSDDGQSWRHLADIDNRPDYDAAYPSVTFVGDEALVAYYSRSTAWARDSEVTLKIFPVRTFYAG